MAPKSLSAKTKIQTLKQGTLPFASSKRTTSSNSIAKAKKTSQATKSITSKRRRISDSSSEDVSLEDVETTSEDDEETVEPEKQGRLPPRPAVRPRIPSDKQSDKPLTAAPQLNDRDETPQAEKLERPELSPKDPRWRKHHAVVRKKMGYQRPSK
jgi:DNA polymerase delta subunit 4